MMAERCRRGDVKTFSIGFGERSFDESAHARRVAEHFGTDHHEEIFTPQTMLDLLPTVVDFLDEPFARRVDPADVPALAVHARVGHRRPRRRRERRAARRLSDLRGRARRAPLSRAAALARAGRRAARRPAARLDRRTSASTSSSSASSAGAALRETCGTRSGSARSRRTSRPRCSTGPSRRSVRRAAAARLAAAPATTRLERLIYLYATTYLQDDILVKVDRASMACSLEVRAPFLDVELVEFLGRVPVAPQAAPLRHEAPPQARDGATRCRPASRAARRRASASRSPSGSRASCARRSRTSSLRRASGAQGIFEPAEVERLVSRAPLGPARPPQAALDAVRLPALASALGRGARRGTSPAAASLLARLPSRAPHEAAPRRGSRLPALARSAAARAPRPTTTSRPAGSSAPGAAALADPRRRPAPRPAGSRRAAAETARAFGWQWQHFAELHPEFEAQFLDWLASDRPRRSSRASACSTPGAGPDGMRYFAAQYGAREVVALDLSDAVETARANLAAFENVARRPGRPPPAAAPHARTRAAASTSSTRSACCTTCPTRTRASARCSPFLRPGGTIAVWVYGYENNGFVRNVVEPLRRADDEDAAARAARPRVAARRRASTASRRASTGRSSDSRVGRSLPLERVHDERRRLQLPPELRDRLRPARRADRRLHQGGGAASAGSPRAGSTDVQISHRHGNSWRGSGRAGADHAGQRRRDGAARAPGLPLLRESVDETLRRARVHRLRSNLRLDGRVPVMVAEDARTTIGSRARPVRGSRQPPGLRPATAPRRCRSDRRPGREALRTSTGGRCWTWVPGPGWSAALLPPETRTSGSTTTG